ncbi:hypothetical protein ILYODFUR_028402 [Ilyodon furcidens]|uniref:Beta-catenin-like protein 1 N-terminal domain-containing protein n=1 Tax=Ilyodon furcidens TaxID=33524 RepID=A0ABV0UNL6_9TELE
MSQRCNSVRSTSTPHVALVLSEITEVARKYPSAFMKCFVKEIGMLNDVMMRTFNFKMQLNADWSCFGTIPVALTSGSALHSQEMVRRGEILDDSMEDEFYLRRLDAGLFVLQLLCYIMVEISSSGVSQLQQRVHQILNIRGGSVKVVRHIMRGKYGSMSCNQVL